jgi:hypothetical protein
MGNWGNVMVMPYRPSFWEQVGAMGINTGLGVLGQLAVAKVAHNWNMDVAEMEIKAKQAESTLEHQRAQQLQKTKGAQAMARTKETGAQARQTATTKAIASGDLVQVPDIELHTMPPPMQQQLVEHEGKFYAQKPDATKLPSHQAKTQFRVVGDKVYAQDYDYNPKTRRRIKVGKPYLAPKTMTEQWFKALLGGVQQGAQSGWEGAGTYVGPEGKNVSITSKQDYDRIFGSR